LRFVPQGSALVEIASKVSDDLPPIG